MCAIVDANVVHEVFTAESRPESGQKFFEWLQSGQNRFVVGGKLRNELSRNANFTEWLDVALQAGLTNSVNDADVFEVTEKLIRSGKCQSDDQHIVALAQISGARLLYSHDKDLWEDFRNRDLLQPTGKIYNTKQGNRRFRKSHKNLLRNPKLCAN